ncbi:MAG TPA: hypothetical protein VGC95_12885 [Chitinophagaceae bacterium]
MRYLLIFLICILALASSEYLFLSELGNQQRMMVLFFTSLVGIVAIVAFFLAYRQLRKDA